MALLDGLREPTQDDTHRSLIERVHQAMVGAHHPDHTLEYSKILTSLLARQAKMHQAQAQHGAQPVSARVGGVGGAQDVGGDPGVGPLWERPSQSQQYQLVNQPAPPSLAALLAALQGATVPQAHAPGGIAQAVLSHYGGY